MIRRSIAAAIVLTFIAGCSGATAPAVPTSVPTPTPTPGMFVPTATLDPSQVEYMPPTVRVDVAPAECMYAIGTLLDYGAALEAVESADLAAIKALGVYADSPTTKHGKTAIKALRKRETLMAVLNAIDLARLESDIAACQAKSEIK